ncbi:MAG TPA: NAD+ synthase [Actinobacteria bacterium]|nr:NAD+ synthase [Actinomycetota bacterium]
MPTLRLALAQANATVGDLEGNSRKILEMAAQAGANGAHLIAFPEMMLTGYPVEDLALRPSYQHASISALDRLSSDLVSAGLGDLVTIVGYLDCVDTGPSHAQVPSPVNAAAVLHQGRIVARYIKHHLPNYGVFDEARYFLPGTIPTHLRIGGTTITLAICEDLWRTGGPVEWAREVSSSLLLVLNASPYERNKTDVRRTLCSERAIEAGCAVAYVNLVGGQDELVFDGDSMVVDAKGKVIARGAQFVEELLMVELQLPDSPIHDDVTQLAGQLSSEEPGETGEIRERLPEFEEIYAALVCGLADYVNKNHFKSVILGLSGGIDSALVAALACDAIGADRVYGVSMPSVYSSEHSKDDAADMAERTGLHLRTVPIAPMVDAFMDSLKLTGLAEENLQARVRGTTLMGISNQEGHLVLTTGNKSELSVGYSTLYGDSVGGFAPIKDVPKMLVWELSRWRNAQAAERGLTPPIPPSSIEKPPSAELRPDQKDSDSLPDYPVLDALLEGYVASDHGSAQLIEAGFDPAMVDRIIRLTDGAEYKRRQSPPGTKISLRAFGRDRRLPITNAWREGGS